MGTIIGIILIIALIVLLMPVFVAIFYIALVALGLYCIYLIYQTIYFKSNKFLDIKNEIKTYADECNELNLHIEELKSAYLDIKHLDYGNATYTDNREIIILVRIAVYLLKMNLICY